MKARPARSRYSHPAGSGWRSAALVGAGIGVGWAMGSLARQFRSARTGVRNAVPHEYDVEDDQFLRSICGVLPPPVLDGNRITTLVNGDQIFPDMLDAIRSAQATLTLETFVYWRGQIAREMADAISARARAGVRCHVLLDWMGSKQMDPSLLQQMDDAGVEVVRFRTPWWSLSEMNHRTHRKLMIVDGRVGFTGGVGIAQEWAGHAQDQDHWRDTHYRVEGPVVAYLQSAFSDNWLKRRREVLHSPDYFPRLDHVGDTKCQAFQSSPETGSGSMQLMFLMGVAAARRTVRIATAYFVPDRISRDALIDAASRGVQVQVLLPGPHIDVRLVREASRRCWPELIEAGIEIFEYMPTMFHWKALIVDELWTSIGSANFDNRSFRLNDEANLNVYDRAFAASQVRLFEEDLSRARRVTPEMLCREPLPRRLADAAASMVGSQL